MGIPRPGLLVVGGLLAIVAVICFQTEAAGYGVAFLLLGLLAAGLSIDWSVDGPRAATASNQDELRTRLLELKSLLDEGVLHPSEYQAKRAALIDAWGSPPKP